MGRPAGTTLALSAAGLLLLTGCGDDAGVIEDLPTGGEVTGDTTVIETPTGVATEESSG